MFAEPETESELVTLLADCTMLGIPYRILGRGSNLFITRDIDDGLVIRTTKLREQIEICGEVVKANAGVSLQRLLHACAEAGLGGCEYLHSVPGNVGGAVFMNAGRGKAAARNLSDHVVKVTWFDGKNIRNYSKRQCRFDYRFSVFQDMPTAVVLSAEIRLGKDSPSSVHERLRERIEFVKRTQDNTAPNGGTVFRHNFKMGEELKGLTKNQACFSLKTSNWILNHGDSQPDDVQSLIDQAVHAHISRGLKKPQLEWTVW